MTNIFKNIYGNLLGFFKLGSSRWSKEVGAGKDYTTIALGVADLENKVVNSPVLTLAAGDYNEIILDGTENLLTNTLELVGDVRDIAGACYMDGFTIFTDSNNGGGGTCAISNSGNDLVVTGTTSNPDFDSAGVIAGDKVLCHDNAGAFAEFTVASVSTNTITLTGTAPTVGNSGTSVTILQNRKIWHATAKLIKIDNLEIGNTRKNKPISITLRGFHLQAQANGIINVNGNISIALEKCTLDKYGDNQLACYLKNAKINANGNNNSVQGLTGGSGGIGIYLYSSKANIDCMCFIGGYYGVVLTSMSLAHVLYCKITNITSVGVYATLNSFTNCRYTQIKNSLTALNSNGISYIAASDTSAHMSNNTTNYNPAISLTAGNFGSYIQWT